MAKTSPLTRRTALACVLAPLVAATLGALPAHAQTYPNKALRVIVPFAAGTATDTIARLVGQHVADALKQPVVVDNRAGANGAIGADAVAKARADGYTLLVTTNTTQASNLSLMKSIPYDPQKDFAPISLLGKGAFVLATRADAPFSTLAEFVNYAQKNPGKLSYASGGSGSPQHLMGELLKLEKHLDIVHIPYKGQGPAMQDVVAGQVQMAFETTTVIAPQLPNGRIRALATTGATRSKNIPDVPTMKELGLPDFVVENWYGVFAPAKTPPALLQRLNQALVKVLHGKEVETSLEKMGSSDVPETQEAFAKFIARELPLWESVVKRSGAKVD